MNANVFVGMVEVTKQRGDRHVLNRFSLELAQGEFVALLGRSGSGKTTILRLIAGLDKPDTGEIWIGQKLASKDGRNLVPPRSRKIGFVFQDLALWPHMTINQSLNFILAASSVPKSERGKRIHATLAAARIPDLGGRYPHQLSGGEQQRVALARALAPQPQLLLLDEPMSSLDADLKAELGFELRSLHRTLALTTVYVTHDISEISTGADRVIRI